jgi:adenosylcobinamide-phosphate guanylyltransferase
MDVTALVMAGGRGSRMALPEEKPLIKIGGKPVIEFVLDALKKATKVNSIVVAVSDHTPKTTEFLLNRSISVVQTPGKDFVSDLGYAIRTLKLQTVLAIGADFPLITGKVIDAIVRYYKLCKKPALSVAVSIEKKHKLGLSGKYEFELKGKLLVPAGINIIDGRRIDEEELDEEIYVLDRKEVAVNINTVEELEIAQNFLKKIHLR